MGNLRNDRRKLAQCLENFGRDQPDQFAEQRLLMKSTSTRASPPRFITIRAPDSDEIVVLKSGSCPTKNTSSLTFRSWVSGCDGMDAETGAEFLAHLRRDPQRFGDNIRRLLGA